MRLGLTPGSSTGAAITAGVGAEQRGLVPSEQGDGLLDHSDALDKLGFRQADGVANDPKVVVKARGKSITRAVDVAQIIVKRMDTLGYKIGIVNVGSGLIQSEDVENVLFLL